MFTELVLATSLSSMKGASLDSCEIVAVKESCAVYVQSNGFQEFALYQKGEGGALAELAHGSVKDKRHEEKYLVKFKREGTVKLVVIFFKGNLPVALDSTEIVVTKARKFPDE